jgi:hypothetical protein
MKVSVQIETCACLVSISLKLLLRNINPAGGLCNGTRLIIKNIFSRLIEAEIAVGEKKRNYYVHTKNGTLTIRY